MSKCLEAKRRDKKRPLKYADGVSGTAREHKRDWKYDHGEQIMHTAWGEQKGAYEWVRVQSASKEMKKVSLDLACCAESKLEAVAKKSKFIRSYKLKNILRVMTACQKRSIQRDKKTHAKICLRKLLVILTAFRYNSQRHGCAKVMFFQLLCKITRDEILTYTGATCRQARTNVNEICSKMSLCNARGKKHGRVWEDKIMTKILSIQMCCIGCEQRWL